MSEQTIEPKAKPETAVMDWPINRRVYKAVIEYEVRAEFSRVTLFTQATGFELARAIFNGTDYMRKMHGHIVSLAEINGQWCD